MEEARRAAIVEEIETWRREGILEDHEYEFLSKRYQPGAPSPARPAPRSATAPPRADRLPAGYAPHLFGGILLGAGLIAFVQFFVPVSGWQPLVALVAAALAMGATFVAERRKGPASAEAGLAASLVTAASVPFYAVSPHLLALPACALVVAAMLLRRGRTPLALVTAFAFFVTAQHAAHVDLLGAPHAGAWVLFAALLAYTFLVARDRASRWGSIALATLPFALALAAIAAVDALGDVDGGLAALAVGALLSIPFALGMRLDARPLVATSGGLITASAMTFAFLAAGAALASMILLLLGAVLVWHAEAMRGYFGARELDGPARVSRDA